MSISIEISVNGGGWPPVNQVADIADASVQSVVAELSMQDVTSELSILLTDDAEIKTINAQWRDQDKPTNVLSFPTQQLSVGQTPGPLMGDIILAFETVEREAMHAGIAVSDHLTHLFVHGLLHLLGYDHENDTEADVMESLETKILAGMDIADPYDQPEANS